MEFFKHLLIKKNLLKNNAFIWNSEKKTINPIQNINTINLDLIVCIERQKKILLEVNIFNFSGNLYNKNLRVDFVKFIRKEKKFKGIDQLRKQIKLDLKVAKQTY